VSLCVIIQGHRVFETGEGDLGRIDTELGVASPVSRTLRRAAICAAY